jgi:proton-translocating NAD(P)+ transhydrogenase subunit alpha
MSTEIETGLYVLVLGSIVGLEIIRRVPSLLHTPLMSLTNAIAGISLVGSLLLASSGQDPVVTTLGAVAVASSTINVVGGFMITNRMLRMFRSGGARPAHGKDRADA